MINIDELTAEIKALTRAPRDAKYASMFGWHSASSELLVSWFGLEGYVSALMQTHKTGGRHAHKDQEAVGETKPIEKEVQHPAHKDQEAVGETKPIEKEVVHPSQKSHRRTSTKTS